MSNVLITGLVSSLLVFVSPALAQRPRYNSKLPILDRCLDSAAGYTTGGRVECGGQEARRQDARMAAAWAALQPTLTDWERRHLSAIQDVWLRWRRLRCDYIDGDPDSGSEARAEAAYCYADMTAERAQELEDMQYPSMLNRDAPAPPPAVPR